MDDSQSIKRSSIKVDIVLSTMWIILIIMINHMEQGILTDCLIVMMILDALDLLRLTKYCIRKEIFTFRNLYNSNKIRLVSSIIVLAILPSIFTIVRFYYLTLNY